MATVEEGKIEMSDGFELYTKTWKPENDPVAALAFVHGFSDHSNRYYSLWPQLNEAGIVVYAFDQRGWGKSVTKPSERGLTGTTAQVLDDIATFIRSHVPSSVPLFMMGHSMGGQETLHFVANGPADLKKQIRGFILSSPYVALHPDEQPSWIKVRAGRLAMKALPRFQLKNPLKPDHLSHDPKWNQEVADDSLCHDTGTLEGLGDMLDRAESLDTGKTLVQDWEGLNMLFLHGDEDHITSYESTKRYFERISVKNKQLKTFSGGFHCLFYEPDHKKQFVEDIIGFVTSLVNGGKSSDSQMNSENQSKL